MSEYQKGSAEYRQERLKEIVQDLHEGSNIKAVRKRFAELIRNVSPEEIAQMEQALIAEGVPVEQVQKVCDVHVQVLAGLGAPEEVQGAVGASGAYLPRRK